MNLGIVLFVTNSFGQTNIFPTTGDVKINNGNLVQTGVYNL